MPALNLSRTSYRDRTLGGWIGMAAGATLGAAREGATDVGLLRSYHVRPDQAVASSHIDLQALSLHVLRAHGASVDSEMLGAAWLRHLRYPWDSYGYGLHAMRRGMRPPMSGAYGNWFAESGWAAARSAIWGMVAPGDPQQAAQRAYRDAVLDHAGEGVWAAMAWAAIVSAAYAVDAPLDLLDVGLAMVPRGARIARTLGAAMSAGRRGAPLLDARRRVLEAASANDPTDAAITLGLSAAGLLYGGGAFGPSVCTTANLGHDAPAACAMVGALCGVLAGASGLPGEWKGPIGDSVVPGWGVDGVTGPSSYAQASEWTADVGERLLGAQVTLVDELPAPAVAASAAQPSPVAPVPEAPARAAMAAADDVDAELVARLRALELEAREGQPSAERRPDGALAPAAGQPDVEAVEPDGDATEGTAAPADAGDVPLHPTPSEGLPCSAVGAPEGVEPPAAPVEPPVGLAYLCANDAIRPLWLAPPRVASFRAGQFEVEVDYGDGGPVIVPEEATSLTVRVRNTGDRAFVGLVQMAPPAGWQIAVPGAQGQRQTLAPGGSARFGFVVRCPEGAEMRHTNALTLVVSPESEAPSTCELPMLAGHCWWVAGPLTNVGEKGFDKHYEPEDHLEADARFLTRSGGLAGWEKRAYKTEDLDLEPMLAGLPGVVYARTTLVMPSAMDARVVAHTNDAVRVWVNRRLVIARHSHEPYRPTLGYGPVQADIALRQGPNDILVKAVADRAGYRLSICVADREGRALADRGDARWLPPCA